MRNTHPIRGHAHGLPHHCIVLFLLLSTAAAGPIAAQGDPTASCNLSAIPLVNGLVYKHTSPSGLGSNIYVFKAMSSAIGTPRVVIFGMGNGNGNGAGSQDWQVYTGHRPPCQALDDVNSIVDVMINQFGIASVSQAQISIIIQHAHLDHANQEFVDEWKALNPLSLQVYYHQRDHELLTCDGQFQGVELEEGPYCGVPLPPGGDPDDHPFLGHPFAFPINIADWTALGTPGEAVCTDPIINFTLADGAQLTGYNDDGHTLGGITMFLDNAAAFTSTRRCTSACALENMLIYEPHNFAPIDCD